MNIIITGKNGYVANSLKKYFNENSKFNCSLVSVKEHIPSFEGIDICIHTAALVHQKGSTYSEQDYMLVNFELTKNIAIQAKKQGVKQFVFFSTMAVYGIEKGILSDRVNCEPKTFYGKSKYKAEQYLMDLQDASFKVVIVRPPMIYGPKCPGNYVTLRKFSKITPVFPLVNNKRSMIFIGNLVELINHLVKNNESGIFHPQDPDLICTTNMVQEISKVHKKPLLVSKVIGTCIQMLIGRSPIYQKIFGDLYYHDNLSKYKDNAYQKYNLKDAIFLSEKDWN